MRLLTDEEVKEFASEAWHWTPEENAAEVAEIMYRYAEKNYKESHKECCLNSVSDYQKERDDYWYLNRDWASLVKQEHDDYGQDAFTEEQLKAQIGTRLFPLSDGKIFERIG